MKPGDGRLVRGPGTLATQRDACFLSKERGVGKCVHGKPAHLNVQIRYN